MAQIYNSQLDAFELYHLRSHEPSQTAPGDSLLAGPALPAIGHALAGAAGSAISNTAVYPLDLIITRLQIQRQQRKQGSDSDSHSASTGGEYASIADAARKIVRTEGGPSALYAGVAEDTGKSIADAFLFFLAYNFLRQLRIRRRSSSSSGPATPLPALDELSVGFAAGALSKLLTTPLANIVTRMQTASMTQGQSQVTAASVARRIRADKGVRGFWSGYSASLVLTLNPSLTFFFYESLKRLAVPRARRDSPGPQATFLLAALSKAAASTITYPFSLAKARAQSSKNDHQTHTQPQRHRRSTVFATVAAIARDEGPRALYEGLSGEVLKGFFSHGITMLVKDAAYKFAVRLYFLLLRLVNNSPCYAAQARAD